MPCPSGVVSATSAAWPNRGLGRGTSQPRPRAAARAASQPIAPRQRIARSRGAASSRSRSSHDEQVARSVGRGLVLRGRAPHGGDDPDAGQGLAVTGGDRGGQGRETGAVQRGVQHVAGGVAGEHPPGAVGAVGGRGQAHEQHLGVGVAERRAGSPPVGLVGERRPPTGPGHVLSPTDETWAGPAHRDPRLQLRDAVGRGRQPSHLRRGARPPGCRRRRGHRATHGPREPVTGTDLR